MVIFHRYVSLPEGKYILSIHLQKHLNSELAIGAPAAPLGSQAFKFAGPKPVVHTS